MEADFTRAKRVSAVLGERYLANLHPRFVDASSLRFLLRAAFYPPATTLHSGGELLDSAQSQWLVSLGKKRHLRFEALG